MPNALTPANILDLTSTQTLFELAIESRELIGRSGAKLIADLKDRAADAEYTHMYFRDPIRPGIVWFSVLGSMTGLQLPTRGRLDECRKTAVNVFPGFLERLDRTDEEEVITSAIPPLTTQASGLELASALEYLVFVYPTMVRAWAALVFTYDQILGLKEGAESARTECIGSCPHAQIVSHLLGDSTIEA